MASVSAATWTPPLPSFAGVSTDAATIFPSKAYGASGRSAVRTSSELVRARATQRQQQQNPRAYAGERSPKASDPKLESPLRRPLAAPEGSWKTSIPPRSRG
eukprot:scaffold3277_cov218-Pinguiococcus_pyrenoidosus.AAC.8